LTRSGLAPPKRPQTYPYSVDDVVEIARGALAASEHELLSGVQEPSGVAVVHVFGALALPGPRLYVLDRKIPWIFCPNPLYKPPSRYG